MITQIFLPLPSHFPVMHRYNFEELNNYLFPNNYTGLNFQKFQYALFQLAIAV